jgi:hypothetical protein
MNCYTPQEAMEIVSRVGVKKAKFEYLFLTDELQLILLKA